MNKSLLFVRHCLVHFVEKCQAIHDVHSATWHVRCTDPMM